MDHCGSPLFQVVSRFATSATSASSYKRKSAGFKAEGGFHIRFTMPQLLGDCGTGGNDECCSILNKRKQKSCKFCLLKYGKDEK